MEEQFKQNNLKPGDAGFVYDKRVDFGKKGQKVDDGWDDEDEEGEDNQYFDDDFN